MFKRKDKVVKETPEENPYVNARRAWNDHVGSVITSRQTWQVVGILSLLIALGAVGGVIKIGSQSKFVPYVIEVDKLGGSHAYGAIRPSSKNDARVISSTIYNFITNARMVSPDGLLQKKAVLDVYAHLSPQDPATSKMNEWMNGTPDSSPFKRAKKEMVSTDILSVLAQTPTTWQVDWTETTRDRKGVVLTPPVTMRALVTVYDGEITQSTTEEQMRVNPLGIYISDFSWQRLN